jgi:hypothetical protein
MVVASIAILGGDHSHSISIERAAGHESLVLHHDAPEPIAPDSPQIDASGHDGDHRFHVADGDDLAMRSEIKATLAGTPALAPTSVLLVPARITACDPRPPFDPALATASRLHRATVLRI